MSLISRSTGIHNHLSPRKKHHPLHPENPPTDQEANAGEPARKRFYEPLKFEPDGDKEAARSASSKSIFHL